MGYVHIKIASPLILYCSAKWRDTTYKNPNVLPLLSHNLSHTITKIILQWYNTINNSITILSFYKGITMGKDHGPINCWLTNIPEISFEGVSLALTYWDQCTIKLGYKHGWTITYLNMEYQAPQPTISQLETNHNNSTIVALVGLCSEP